VVLVVVRMHHAVEYEIHTAAAPEKAIANNKKFRVAGGLRKLLVLILCVCEREETLTS
jgi:hypothetical protein